MHDQNALVIVVIDARHRDAPSSSCPRHRDAPRHLDAPRHRDALVILMPSSS